MLEYPQRKKKPEKYSKHLILIRLDTLQYFLYLFSKKVRKIQTVSLNFILLAISDIRYLSIYSAMTMKLMQKIFTTLRQNQETNEK
jgi:D-alanyl-lipoteichoic acid acyltransferase DltB (MBOAT superfamily)